MINRFFSCLVACALMLPVAVSANESELSPDAAATVERYFGALQTGDTSTLQTLLTGRIKNRQQALLSNPQYAAELAKDNAERNFRIVNHSTNRSGMVTVDYQMGRAGERISKRLYLVQSRGNTRPAFLILEDQLVP